MPKGWPDFTVPITIEAVTVETLPVDIKAQTVGNLAIDVAAQTVGNLNIDIKAVSDAVPVSNLGCLVNADFEDDWLGWGHQADCFIDDIVFSSGVKSVKIGHMNAVWQELSPALRGDRIKSLRLAYRSQVAGANKAIVTLRNSDGSYTQTYLSPAAKDTWYTVDVTTDPTKEAIQFGLMGYAGAGKYVNFDTIGLALKEVVDAVNVTVNVDIVAQTVGNLAVDIAAQTVGNLAVDIAAQTVGNIAIDIAAQTVGNLNVDIKAQTVDLNIKTSSGVNIVIDKLTQTAYVEDRRTLSNHGTSPSPTSYTGNERRGKFFPRGCRGFIKTIDVYCSDAGAAGGTITVYISPFPGMGYVASATVTVGAGASADWRSATFNRMWNYDSLFIFVVCSGSDIKIYYNSNTPYDQYASADAGATWTANEYRYWFRAVMKGETVGDIPVSGTLNTIEILSVASERFYKALGCDAITDYTFVDIYGPGTLLFINWLAPAGAISHLTLISIYIDDQTSPSFRWNFSELNLDGYTPTTPGIQLLSYAENGRCVAQTTLPFKWQRHFKVVIHTQPAGVYNVEGAANLQR